MSEQPRSNYLQYLPAIYHEDPFVGQFLLPFEQVLTGFQLLLSQIDSYFAPAHTDPDFLPWLATWVALVLDEEWDEAKRRQLIAEAVQLYRWRGTVKGLKRYLEIYTGLVPDIRECCWPGGMQIGVASQIGGTESPPSSSEDCQPSVSYDYYVIDTIAPAGHTVEIDSQTYNLEGQPLQLYYHADQVKRVDVGSEHGERYVVIERLDGEIHRHQPATITRRDGLIDSCHILTLETAAGTESVEYRGNTFLIGEVEQPYRFVVETRVPAADIEEVKLDKVRGIIDLEKPAHTMYYLKLTPVVSEYVLQPMQIEVRSTIELDTTVG